MVNRIPRSRWGHGFNRKDQEPSKNGQEPSQAGSQTAQRASEVRTTLISVAAGVFTALFAGGITIVAGSLEHRTYWREQKSAELQVACFRRKLDIVLNVSTNVSKYITNTRRYRRSDCFVAVAEDLLKSPPQSKKSSDTPTCLEEVGFKDAARRFEDLQHYSKDQIRSFLAEELEKNKAANSALAEINPLLRRDMTEVSLFFGRASTHTAAEILKALDDVVNTRIFEEHLTKLGALRDTMAKNMVAELNSTEKTAAVCEGGL